MASLRLAARALRSSATKPSTLATARSSSLAPAYTATQQQRRGYADVASDKIQLSLALPHSIIYKSKDVVQVNIPAESGEMGVLAQHVPSIEQLKPGLIEVIEESGGSKQFFLSGGFATVQPGSKLSVNAVEGYPLEDFNADMPEYSEADLVVQRTQAVRDQISEAQKIANGGGSEKDIAEARIELEVLESLQNAMK
ncbi:MAG: delta subunit of the central stalk of mitochondrial F1F0 ATP synthase, atp16 [Alyxoria varia]|nr:MAG: delta subunit of the central stalk of mitochondrial F1F0 ATP synthase, atp16 [Alyxoria varia]